MWVIVLLIAGAFVLFLIIANAVKMGVKEALQEFKDDIIKELHPSKEQNNNNSDVDQKGESQ